jgi:DNA-binding transcriptional MocR family regulator
MLWVELPSKVDSMSVYQLALENEITIGRGYMFSISDTRPTVTRPSV